MRRCADFSGFPSLLEAVRVDGFLLAFIRPWSESSWCEPLRRWCHPRLQPCLAGNLQMPDLAHERSLKRVEGRSVAVFRSGDSAKDLYFGR